MKLSDKYWDNSGKGDYQISYFDVKKAVLKFEERLRDDEAVFNENLSEKEYCEKYNLTHIYEENITDFYKKVFGTFK